MAEAALPLSYPGMRDVVCGMGNGEQYGKFSNDFLIMNIISLLSLLNPTMINTFTNLKAYQFSLRLLKKGYEIARQLPPEERFNRADQLRRSLSSISANIAEGYGRYHYQETIQFCRQARGSLEESISHLITARELGQISADDYQSAVKLAIQTRQLLNGYIRFLRKQQLK